jgi:RimJ/RimL family protein N-acetyltransferase
MRFFPSVKTKEETELFILRMQNEYKERAYCYFAVDLLANGEFAGFIGISIQTFESDFTPCKDIGWRLKRSLWGRGVATEGAQRCIEFAFKDLKFSELFAIAPIINQPSIHLMQKLGMKKVQIFQHPALIFSPELSTCALYGLRKK